uniref:Uncharacterized protein n=1 Tax=Anguilla anguilla TaxID=7936 RepID=A0A0E9RUR2_ANGAN
MIRITNLDPIALSYEV